jgi:hypothetical protein
MADGQTLVDFIVWAVQNYPADKYVLILSDHGMGWPGGWSDSDPVIRSDSNIPLEARLDDHLYLQEIDQALGQARKQTGIDAFELIGMDACLMGHLEVLSALQAHARYAVVSQEVEPALGWAYTSFLNDLVQNPDMDGSELSRHIVESYVVDDQRIVDDQARAAFLRQGSPMGGMFGLFQSTPQQLARQLEADVTLTGVDLSAIPALLNSFNDFAYALQQARQQDVAFSRTHAQSFTSVFGSDVPPSYIDLGSFLQVLQQNGIGGPAIEAVQNALQQAVVAEKNGPKKPGATGISIYFPNSDLYKLATTGPRSYTAIASRFAAESLWDDFLAYHYTGRSFGPATQELVVPSRQAVVQPPGAGKISVSPIKISSRSVAPGQKVTLSADINGKNIGYVYLFVGYLDQQSNSIFVADTDYLESKETREANGIYYPVWPESGSFTMQFQWEPVVFAISDEQQSVVTAMRPETYGVSFKQAVYTVDGIYTFADGRDQRYARLYFTDEAMTHVYGFTDANMTGAPHEIIPSRGDQFTVLQRWMELDASGQSAN